MDLGEDDASSVYFYFDPSASKRSLGTFSFLYELQWLAERKKRYHYLGFYNKDCGPLRYKAGFAPHELLQIGAEDALWTLDSP
jgi:arginine-tRNA-protein transferase